MSFLKNLFSEKNHLQFLESLLENFLNSCGFSLYFDIEEGQENRYKVDLFGKDEELLIKNDGKLLKAIQVYLSLVLSDRNRKKEDGSSPVFIKVDSLGFLAQAEKEVMSLAQKLKQDAIRKARPIVMREYLNSYQRRKIHQELTKDGKVKTSSIGDGNLKKIKIFPITGNSDDPGA